MRALAVALALAAAACVAPAGIPNTAPRLRRATYRLEGAWAPPMRDAIRGHLNGYWIPGRVVCEDPRASVRVLPAKFNGCVWSGYWLAAASEIRYDPGCSAGAPRHVLRHEFAHALGADHVCDHCRALLTATYGGIVAPPTEPTPRDLAELRRVGAIPPGF